MASRTLFLCTFALASLAGATPTFTGVIQTETGQPPPGTCAVCHQGGIGMMGNVTTPFGQALRANGLMPNNEASLTTALNALRTMNTDSDGDGCPDLAELSTAPPTNPNRADCSAGGDGGTLEDGGMGGGTAGGATGGGGTELPPLSYGCGSNVVPGLFGLAALLVALWRPRR